MVPLPPKPVFAVLRLSVQWYHNLTILGSCPFSASLVGRLNDGIPLALQNRASLLFWLLFLFLTPGNTYGPFWCEDEAGQEAVS